MVRLLNASMIPSRYVPASLRNGLDRPPLMSENKVSYHLNTHRSFTLFQTLGLEFMHAFRDHQKHNMKCIFFSKCDIYKVSSFFLCVFISVGPQCQITFFSFLKKKYVAGSISRNLIFFKGSALKLLSIILQSIFRYKLSCG